MAGIGEDIKDVLEELGTSLLDLEDRRHQKARHLSQERVRELFDYNPITGDLIRNTTISSVAQKGEFAGSPRNGYLVTNVDGSCFLNHRIIWLWYYGYMPEGLVDHRDRIRHHNWIDNLREASRVCNIQNTGNYKNNISGVKGVSWKKRDNKWCVQVAINRKVHHIGCYVDFLEAVCHRLAAEQCIGWDECDSSSPAYLFIRGN